MKIVDSVKTYFRDLSADVVAITREKETKRITSVALRVLGGLAAVMTVSPALSAVIAVLIAPFSLLFSLAMTVVGVVLSHDLIKTGYNMRTEEPVKDKFANTYLFQRINRWVSRNGLHPGKVEHVPDRVGVSK